MDAVFTDSSGAKRNFLWQYDKDQTLVIENLEYSISPEIHFTTTALDEALIAKGEYKDGVLKVQIPNALLMYDRKITVYLYLDNALSGETVKKFDIVVRPRKKPSDYVYFDNVYITGINGITDAVFDYLEKSQEILDDVIVDYTTVHLTDDVTGVEYLVGINDGKLYMKALN